jgi:hypothetical protein
MDKIKARQTEITAYLHNDLNIEIYEDLTESKDWKGLFEPLEFFNMLYTEFEFFKTNVLRYLDIKKHFGKLKLKEEQRYYFLWALTQVIDEAFPHDQIYWDTTEKSRDYINNLYDEIKGKLYPEPVEVISEWSFDNVKEHIATLPDTKEKIKYLIEVKTDYEQNAGIDLTLGTPFNKQCEFEIKKLKAFEELEKDANNVSQKSEIPVSKFKLRESILSKADFIRIVNALSEMKAFETNNSTAPNKKDVMIAFGNLVGLDLSSYHTDLNKALEKSEQTNIEIFEKLKEKTIKVWNEKDQNIKK